MNVPDNPAIQDALKEAQRYLIAVDVALAELSKYRTPSDYERECKALNMLIVKFHDKVTRVFDIKPQLVKKVL